MQTEDFDDAFRRNIDRAEHEDVSDREVEKIANYVKQKRSNSNKLAYLMYGSVTLMLATIGGLLTWNLVQMQEKRTLEDTINSLNHNRATNLINNNVVVKRDTVYIKAYDQSTHNFKKIEEAKIMRSQNKLTAVLENDFKTNNAGNESAAAKDILKADKGMRVKNKYTKSKTSNILTGNSKAYNAKIADKNTATIDRIKKIDNLVLLSDNPVIINDLTFQTLRSCDSIIVQPIKPQSYFKNFTYQVGAGTNIADDQKSLSVLMGINLNNHWNISTGINFLKIDNNSENDKDDFHYYSNFNTITDTSQFTFLGVKQTIYQVPVTIGYNIPLVNNFFLLFGLGSDLDIYATQHLRYKLNQEEKSTDKRSPVLVFNNAVISVGVIKNWQRISLQLSPFINPQITRVSYKKTESYYGGRIRLFYTFKRK